MRSSPAAIPCTRWLAKECATGRSGHHENRGSGIDIDPWDGKWSWAQYFTPWPHVHPEARTKKERKPVGQATGKCSPQHERAWRGLRRRGCAQTVTLWPSPQRDQRARRATGSSAEQRAAL
eukprot:scaffold59452_cov66-Phaeocystis_antarctica.AAC.2